MSKLSAEKLKGLLAASGREDAAITEFIRIWPLIEAILEAFSKATKLPIFTCINDVLIFESSSGTMPPFCALMLSIPELAVRCRSDATRRASKFEPDIHEKVQYCHAGMVNGRREIDAASVGRLTILFGAKPSYSSNALQRRASIIQIGVQQNPELGARLEEALAQDDRTPELEQSDSLLMDAIADVIQRLLAATVSAHEFALNMAHEISLLMEGLGLFSDEACVMATEILEHRETPNTLALLQLDRQILMTQSRLGLYVVRNFFSHIGEVRYKEVVRPNFTLINLRLIMEEMLELYQLQAAQKQVLIESAGVEKLPKIHGSAMEIRRLLHNILSNAVKYSYHSIHSTQRKIRVRTKVPYDPGFRERRFAIVVDNYGLGLTEEEKPRAFEPGFRGQQAVREVPIGAGIGLSEAAKIMKVHHGQMRMRSEKLHGDSAEAATYLTTVELIFPYTGGHDPSKRGGR